MSEQAEEIWKDIPGFEGCYQASTLGKIRSLDRYTNYKDKGTIALKKGRILSPKISNKGYLEVVLVINGIKSYKRVHQLVAATFLPNPNSYPHINHINEIKTDNRIVNLEWCTPKQNIEAYNESRTIVYQYDLQGNFIKVWNSLTKAAKSVNGDKTGIHHCCVGKLSDGKSKKTYKGYIWTYESMTDEEKKSRTTNSNLTKVQQLDLEGNVLNTYNSTIEAAKAVGCNPSAITMACSGLRNIIKGYKWRKN